MREPEKSGTPSSAGEGALFCPADLQYMHVSDLRHHGRKRSLCLLRGTLQDSLGAGHVPPPSYRLGEGPPQPFPGETGHLDTDVGYFGRLVVSLGGKVFSGPQGDELEKSPDTL